MIKKCCDSCDQKIDGEYIDVSFNELVFSPIGEFGHSDSHDFCFACYKNAIQLIEENATGNTRKIKRKVKEIMNGE